MLWNTVYKSLHMSMEDYTEDIGLKIKRINELIYRHSNERLVGWDMTMTQCRILSILSAQPGERPPRDVWSRSCACPIPPSSAS